MSALIDPWLLERLVCPMTRTKLRQDGNWLISDADGLAYPIQDGVPVLLTEASVPRDGGGRSSPVANEDRGRGV